MKRCIYFYPQPIKENPSAGSALRPYQMLQAFRDIGYQVDAVIGHGAERKAKIREVRENIKNGVQYDFTYCENVNEPMLLTEKDHIPRYPFMDFRFFKLCRRHNIPIGLFYRDVYWKFPIFAETVSLPKRLIEIPLFHYDLARYRKWLNVLYLPTFRMQQYVMENFPSRELPPGGVLRPDSYARRRSREAGEGLKIFYVGSISSLYDNKMLFQAVQETPGVYLTVCTHQKQWEQCLSDYAPYLCDRITVVHQSGDALREHYENADVAAYCLNHDEYLDMAMPIKVFEAIGYGTPLVATSIYSIAELVRRNDIGWVTETSVDGIKKILAHLRDNPQEVREKTENTIRMAAQSTWRCRAEQVARELTELKQ